ncbi:MAG: hypothetical protein K6G16_10345 [Lachnospiraceae bacterium]|nr:hypothetical protein [Lachnospiraceae bacterium]
MLSLQEMNELKRVNMDTYRSIAERAGIPETAVPVRIFNGECTIDFAAIRDYVGFLL